MTASSAVVLGNLAYLIGAVVLATLGGLIVWFRNRKPRSVTANVKSFHRGLQALAPTTNGSSRPVASGGVRIHREPEPAASTEPVTPGEMVKLHRPSGDGAEAGEGFIPTNGSGRHHESDCNPEADAFAPVFVDRTPTPPHGVVGLPPAAPLWANGTADLPPVPPSWANGTADLPPVPPLWANGTTDLPPVPPPSANGTSDPPSTAPDPPEPADPLVIDEPVIDEPVIDVLGSDRRVAGRAGVEAG